VGGALFFYLGVCCFWCALFLDCVCSFFPFSFFPFDFQLWTFDLC